ncbi:MAG: universal stress protein [Planctomycetes bacterium]|nr:universal stress protein [Planctomycetota bacterium]
MNQAIIEGAAMFGRILVPLDTRPESEIVLAEVQRVAPRKAEVFLVHVIPQVSLSAGSELSSVLALPEQAERYLARTARKLRNMSVRVFVDAGEPSERIVKVSLALNVGLIAMATHGRQGVKRLLLGSVARDVLRASPVPVLLVRPGASAPARPMKRVLVPVDGSDRSQRMLDVVSTMAAGTPLEVVLLHVVSEEGAADSENSMARDLRETAQELRRRGMDARSVVVRGQPIEAILRQAKALDIDMIAMATHGRTGLDRLIMGSVTEGVLTGADRPVMVLRSSPRPLAVRR